MSLSREEIIRMALEFGWSDCDKYRFDIDELQQFTDAICAAEREACANECEIIHKQELCANPAEKCASAIRARGNGGEK